MTQQQLQYAQMLEARRRSLYAAYYRQMAVGAAPVKVTTEDEIKENPTDETPGNTTQINKEETQSVIENTNTENISDMTEPSQNNDTTSPDDMLAEDNDTSTENQDTPEVSQDESGDTQEETV